MRWLFAALICGLVGLAQAAMQTNIGTLTCTLVEGNDRETSPPSRSRAMLCSFKPGGNGPEERYTGEIKSVGSNETLAGKLVLMWAVIGPDYVSFAPGLLQQTFMGRMGTSGGGETKTPPMLVGESDESFVLRSLNESEPSGANSVTVISLKVESTPA